MALPAAGGKCPADHPIKGNADSLVYHTPSHRFYSQTKAEICFDPPAAAHRGGFRRAKL